MKFLIDAHLPQSLCELFIRQGHDCIHTSQLPNQNRTSDSEIRSISVSEDRIVITKDTDFLHSFILKREPRKLIFVTTGNLRLNDLKNLFESKVVDVIRLIEAHQMLEISTKGIIVIA